MSLFILRPDHAEEEILASLAEAFDLDWGQDEKTDLTFLDTFDWRLFTRGISLTALRRGSVTRIALQEGMETMPEVPVRAHPAFSRELPPGPVRDVVHPISGIRRLLPRARMRGIRRTAALLNEDTKTVVRIRLTRGEVALPRSRDFRPMPAAIEIMSLKGYGPEARAVRRHLGKPLGLLRVEKGLMALALETLGDTPGIDPSDPEVELAAEMTAEEGARAIHRALLSVMEANQEGVFEDLDPEFLHDFRVAVRRTRVALGQLKGIFPPKELEHFRKEFAWLGGRTGPTRDMDVYLLKIPEYQEALPGGVRDELAPLVHFLKRKKATEHRRLTRSMGTRRYRNLKEDWAAFLEREEPSEPRPVHASEPLGLLASRRIWKLYRKVLAGGRAAMADAPPEALHQLRIQCKRLRYLITFFQSLYPRGKVAAILKALKDLQETLGDFNDLHVQQLALRRFAEEMLETDAGPPETLMAMGRLMGQLETQSEVERSRFSERFAAFSDPDNVGRFEALFHPS